MLQSYLFRTEDDARDLAVAGSRVRLVKGAYKEPAAVAYQDKAEVDKAYVRCLKILMAGDGLPDGRPARPAADRHRPGAGPPRRPRAADEYEFQMLYGIRTAEQQRGWPRRATAMRVYVPYGTDWYGYFMRRLAERPANLAFFLRSLATR